MKRFYLIVLVFSFVSFAYSQEIVNPDKVWSIMEEHCQPWGSNYSTEFIRFDTDTIIDGTVYQKVWIAEDEYHQNWNFYGAFIREDEGLVYYRELFSEEVLIYNFNLEIGDSVVVDNPRAAGALTLVLAEIDSVLLENGEARERWKLTNNIYSDFEYWIRGIGSQTGVINSSTGVYGGLCGLFTLLCESETDELFYLNPEYESCYLYITDINDKDYSKSDDLFIMSCNYINKSIQIKMNNNNCKTVFISDIRGSIIKSEQLISKNYEFNFSEYPQGIYVVTVLENGKISSIKLLVR